MPDQQAGTSPFKDVKVLVVDANDVTAKLVVGVLKTFGFVNVDIAKDGLDAHAMTQVKPYGFIICDWQMNGLSGVEFVRKVRQDSASPNRYIPIIMVTANTNKAAVTEARDAGVNEFMVKPFTAESLRSKLIEIIERPRNFIISRGYVGPDRRRQKKELPQGATERRQTD